VRYFESMLSPRLDQQGHLLHLAGIVLDITERKQAETELRRINRTSRMISECDQVLVRATDEAELLRAICHLVVDVGGYRMAWVGFAEQDEAKSVRPVAQAGVEEGYLDIANITWADTERGRSPVGTAIRREQTVVSRNILTDPAFGPWRQAAIQRGYAALAALPLKRDQRVFGALAVYASEPNTFDPDEVGLLTQLADDLAYGITVLRTRLDQKRIEDELHLLSARLLQVRDLERRYLARELHDTTAQHLAALSLGLTNLKGLLSKSSERVAGLCADCLNLAQQAAQEIRTHSYLLHPPLLEAMGLIEAVEDYADGFSARTGIAVEVKASADFGRLPDNMELALFRIVQESLANVLKHSRSARAEISFKRQHSSVILKVRDMGRGIAADLLARISTMRGGTGVGLGGMHERMRLLGGKLDLESGPTGTTVCATVPLVELSPESKLDR
jgi:signal transduction histidine kinase